MVHWLRFWSSTAGGKGLIPDLRTKTKNLTVCQLVHKNLGKENAKNPPAVRTKTSETSQN